VAVFSVGTAVFPAAHYIPSHPHSSVICSWYSGPKARLPTPSAKKGGEMQFTFHRLMAVFVLLNEMKDNMNGNIREIEAV
jgi:hypothetical protein